ncbi:MAG: YgfZ/GcvT domain-containing protein [Opitutales bacterium]
MSTQLFESKPTGIVRVSGEDALPYLQSQLTIDFRKLPIHGTRLGLRLSRKGRVLFGAQVIREAEEEYILVCRDTRPSDVIERLEENVVADEVEFSQEEGSWKEWVLHHPNSLNEVYSLTGLDPVSNRSARPLENGWAYIDTQLPPHCLTLLTCGDTQPSWAESVTTASSTNLEVLRLQAGIFRAGLEIGEDEFPQEGGLEKEAVDFDKGCYLGQEVMARIHAMGKVRNSAVAVQGTMPVPSSLPVGILDNGKKVGKLKTQFALDGGQGWIGAAILHEKALPTFSENGLTLENSSSTIHPLNR